MYLYLPKRHKSIKENILAWLAIPAAVEGVITAAPQHGWSLGETRDWGSIWGLGVLLKSCPYLDSKTPSIWLFPCIQKLSAKSCRNCFAFFFKKKHTPNQDFSICCMLAFWVLEPMKCHWMKVFHTCERYILASEKLRNHLRNWQKAWWWSNFGIWLQLKVVTLAAFNYHQLQSELCGLLREKYFWLKSPLHLTEDCPEWGSVKFEFLWICGCEAAWWVLLHLSFWGVWRSVLQCVLCTCDGFVSLVLGVAGGCYPQYIGSLTVWSES